MDKQILKDSDNDNLVSEVHKMAQIALGKQVDIECTKWAIEEGLFDNFVALYKAGYKRDTTKTDKRITGRYVGPAIGIMLNDVRFDEIDTVIINGFEYKKNDVEVEQ